MNKTEDADNYNDEIDLKEIFLLLWKQKITIILITSVFAISSVFYSLSLPNIYTSSALLASASDDQSLSPSLGGVSSLASLAGVSIPSVKSSKTDEAIERIKSFDFFTNYFLPNIALENLLAVKKWNKDENVIIYDDNIYNSITNKWNTQSQKSDLAAPSNQKAYVQYKDILGITVDDTSGFVTLSINHQSPNIAKEWLDLIIFHINESMREIDKRDAQNAIDYLNQTSKDISIQSVRQVINALLENKMQTLMLASSNKAYVFKIIDSPIIPEVKSSPLRSIICIVGTFLGGFFSMIIVFIRHYFKQS